MADFWRTSAQTKLWRRKKVRKLIPLLLVLLLLGCFGLKREYPKRDFYTLKVVNIMETDPGAGRYYLKIQRSELNPAYFHRDFNYKIRQDEFISDYYNQFYKPVTTIVTAELYKWLSNSGLFKDVLPIESIIKAKYLLDSLIVDIYADFADPINPKAVLNMQFFLVDDSGPHPELVYTNVYNQTVELAGKGPDSVVDGWNKALENIFNQLQSDLKSVKNL